MSKDTIKVDIGNGQTVVITQSPGDLKEGIKQSDLTRISGYTGTQHIHFGTDSATIIRDKGNK